MGRPTSSTAPSARRPGIRAAWRRIHIRSCSAGIRRRFCHGPQSPGLCRAAVAYRDVRDVGGGRWLSGAGASDVRRRRATTRGCRRSWDTWSICRGCGRTTSATSSARFRASSAIPPSVSTSSTAKARWLPPSGRRSPARNTIPDRFPSCLPIALFCPSCSQGRPNADWTARVGVASEASRVAANRGAARTLALLGLGALGSIIGLGFAVHAARAAANLAAVQSEFVSAVSHEMKTPLSLIKLASNTLANGRFGTPTAVADYGRMMSTEAEQLTRLIDNVLYYARINDSTSDYDLETVDIAEMIQESIDRSRSRLNELGFEVQVQPAGRSAVRPGGPRHDGARLRQPHRQRDQVRRLRTLARRTRLLQRTSGPRRNRRSRRRDIPPAICRACSRSSTGVKAPGSAAPALVSPSSGALSRIIRGTSPFRASSDGGRRSMSSCRGAMRLESSGLEKTNSHR